ncbi:MAG: DMT family transporter [Lachnospiraceae bacterium]
MSKLKLTLAMILFGSIGLFVHYLPYESSCIALVRGVLGTLFLIFFQVARGKKTDWAKIRKNAVCLCISGALIGLNWILLFESYRYTTVAVATLCYYFMPMIVLILSPFVLKEAITKRKVMCMAVALCGMVCVSGVSYDGLQGMTGIVFALGAATLYAIVVIVNQFLEPMDAIDCTIVQLSSSAIILLPYTVLSGLFGELYTKTTALGIVLLLVVGIIHTGVAYSLYFSSMKDLDSQTVAIFGYLDPVVAVILSAAVLGESLTMGTVVGGVLILGSTWWMNRSEQIEKK